MSKRDKCKDNEDENMEDFIDEFDLDILINGINAITPKLNKSNFKVIKHIFEDKVNEYEEIIKNFEKEKKSIIYLCYGNNNEILELILDNYINQYNIKYGEDNDNTSKIIKIKYNGYTETNEELVLKSLCKRLNLVDDKYNTKNVGMMKYKQMIMDYIKNNKNCPLIVIYYNYIEHLVTKKKQILLYTLCEMIDNTNNILLIGFTKSLNILNQMEKRVFSRFSKQTLFITIPDIYAIIGCIENLFTKIDDSFFVLEGGDAKTKKKIIRNLKGFFHNIISYEYPDFFQYIYNSYNYGKSLDFILGKIHIIFCLFMVKLKNYKQKNNTNVIESGELSHLFDEFICDFVKKEDEDTYFHELIKMPNIHICILICLCCCVVRYKEKITVNLIYKLYIELFVKSNTGVSRSKFNEILIEKYLEELKNCNIIHIERDDKYGCIYSLKKPLEDMKEQLIKLKEAPYNKLDTGMCRILEEIR